MPAVTDFRLYAFNLSRVDAAGKNIGGKVYWKLFAIENLVRIIVHSILTDQAGKSWWGTSVDPGLRARVAQSVKSYASQPWYTKPGNHDIYYTYLSDLTKIIAANSNLFKVKIPDIDQWIVQLERIRVPRNIVGHMNWPDGNDRKRIDVCHADLQQLMDKLAKLGVILSNP